MVDILRKVQVAIEQLQIDSMDYSVQAIANKLGCNCVNDTLIFSGGYVPLIKMGWLEVGHQYSKLGQWEIDRG